ncbi:CRAL-TRIO domain-containing protein [Xylogone sp. PMI_703]|nr:CRAL-TRIO domain-containing protein [Xylogone sp. PMI_703]
MDKAATAPGTLGNLTLDEECKLQEAWIYLLQYCGVENSHNENAEQNNSHIPPLNGMSSEHFKQCLWNFILGEHPDATILRFLRARKWDVEKAMEMLTADIYWRDERHMDEDIVQKGETVVYKKSPTPDEKGFIQQYRSGKAYVRGADKESRPVFIIKVRLHDPKAQSPEAMETFVLHNIETLRSMIKAPIDTASIIFDLTRFGLRNMDFHVVKFLIQVFEARYPETLGVVLVHNAPFIFWGIWKIIRPWLDPVIASKIHFTRNNNELTNFISPENLQTCYGGQDTWEYKYIELEPGENERMESEKKPKLQAERNELIHQFEQLTVQWVGLSPESPAAKERESERKDVAKQLYSNYWKLDPYIRAKTYYHRAGVIDALGEVDLKGAR